MDLSHPYVIAALSYRPAVEVPASDDVRTELLRADSLWCSGHADEVRALLDGLALRADWDNGRFGPYASGLRALCAGELQNAYEAYCDAVRMDTSDVFAGERAVSVAFWMVEPAKMLAAAELMLDAVEQQPFAGGVVSFAQHMGTDSATAEATARRAIAKGFDDVWTLHAVAHCMYHEGRLAECQEWCVASRPAAVACTTFMRTHLEFHLALCLIGLKNSEDLTMLVDGPLWGSLPSAERDDHWAAAGLLNVLWKAELHGVELQADTRVQEALKHLESANVGKSMVFDLCIQRFKGALWCDQILEIAEKNKQKEFAGFAKAVDAAYVKHDWTLAAQELAPVRADVVKLGASPEQRETIDDFVKVVDSKQ